MYVQRPLKLKQSSSSHLKPILPTTSYMARQRAQTTSGGECWKCKKGSQAGESWLQCDTCDLWYHKECSGLPVDRIQQLNSTKVNYLLSRCAVCVQKRNLQVSTRKAIEDSIEDSLPTLVENFVQKP